MLAKMNRIVSVLINATVTDGFAADIAAPPPVFGARIVGDVLGDGLGDDVILLETPGPQPPAAKSATSVAFRARL